MDLVRGTKENINVRLDKNSRFISIEGVEKAVISGFKYIIDITRKKMGPRTEP